MPVRPLIPPEQAMLFVEEVHHRLALVSLSPEEYFAAIRDTASRGFNSGRIFDRLLSSVRRQMQGPGHLHLESQTLPVPGPLTSLLASGPRDPTTAVLALGKVGAFLQSTP